MPESSRIEVVDAAFSYGEQTIFERVTFVVEAGESLALMGASGSGKSTLLRCLAGLARPKAGAVLVAGTDLARAGERERARQRLTSIGVVTQGGDLLPELSVRENVALPLLLAGVRRQEAFERAQAHLESLGIGTLGARGTWEISGGQYHRSAIARALVIEPQIIVGDEPTAALDADTADEVVALLVGTAANGIAVVIATHDARVAERCHRVGHLSRGRLVVSGAR